MLIELNVTPATSGRHTGGGGIAAVVLDPASRASSMQLAEVQSQVDLDPESGVVPAGMEHQLQERLLVIDKRLRQAMYNSS